MNRITIPAAIIGLALVCLAPAFAQTSQGATGHGSMPMRQMGETGAASMAYMDAMKKMDAAMGRTKMSGKAGIDFARMMIPHHQSAIDMAKAYLKSNDSDPQLTRLSNEIITAQKREIAFLKRWLKKNGG